MGTLCFGSIEALDARICALGKDCAQLEEEERQVWAHFLEHCPPSSLQYAQISPKGVGDQGGDGGRVHTITFVVKVSRLPSPLQHLLGIVARITNHDAVAGRIGMAHIAATTWAHPQVID